MAFVRSDRTLLLQEWGDSYVQAALSGIVLEYPHLPLFVRTGPDAHRTHRERHPAFFGCYVWHSAVAMQ